MPLAPNKRDTGTGVMRTDSPVDYRIGHRRSAIGLLDSASRSFARPRASRLPSVPSTRRQRRVGQDRELARTVRGNTLTN